MFPSYNVREYSNQNSCIRIRSDHNEDATAEVLLKWSRRIENKGEYHSVSRQVVDPPPYRQDDQGNLPLKWTEKRFRHVIRLKEEAIRIAKRLWADYIWVI